jgi:hypothetical protein
MRSPQFRLRTLMVVVALAALLSFAMVPFIRVRQPHVDVNYSPDRLKSFDGFLNYRGLPPLPPRTEAP